MPILAIIPPEKRGETVRMRRTNSADCLYFEEGK